MKNIKKTLIIFCLITNVLYAQNNDENINPWSFKVGTGLSLQGRGDYITINYENSLEYYFKSNMSLSIDYTLSSQKDFEEYKWDIYKMNKMDLMLHSKFWTGDKGKFKWGLGLAYINVGQLHASEWHYNNNISYNINSIKINTLGIIYSVDFHQKISNNLFLEYRIFQNIYFSEISTGFSFRVGYQLN